MPTFALNFSRPGAQVVAQYYNFLRLGFEGYRRGAGLRPRRRHAALRPDRGARPVRAADARRRAAGVRVHAEATTSTTSPSSTSRTRCASAAGRCRPTRSRRTAPTWPRCASSSGAASRHDMADMLVADLKRQLPRLQRSRARSTTRRPGAPSPTDVPLAGAYSGSPVRIEELLYKPQHSLIDQSLHSQLGAETTNGDGFGIGWYGVGETPGVFHSVEPAWNDRNLRELAAHIESRLVFAHIRASSGSPVQQTNCHPFRHGRWLWMHNGADPRVPRRSSATSPSPSTRPLPVDRGLDRLRGVLLPRADARARGRPAGRRRARGRADRGRRARSTASSTRSR